MDVRVSRKAHSLRSELYRGLIIAAAESEFAEHGFAGARMQRVADEVGLSVGTLYNLFENKEGLYETILKLRGGALMERLMGSLATDQPFLTLLGNVVRTHLDFSVEHPGYLRISMQRVNLWWSPDAQNGATEAPFATRGIETTAALCKAAIERGELVADDPRRIVLTLTGVHQAHLQQWLDGGMSEAPEHVAARIVDLFRRMYAA